MACISARMDSRSKPRCRVAAGLTQGVPVRRIRSSTIEPRKNLRRLLEGFAARSRAGDLPHQLVCVGPYGWLCRDLEEQIERLGIEHQVRFTGYVPFDDLPAIYNLAEMFVFPSL